MGNWPRAAAGGPDNGTNGFFKEEPNLAWIAIPNHATEGSATRSEGGILLRYATFLHAALASRGLSSFL